MRKPFLLSLLVLLLTTIATHAYDFKSGDLYYNITSYTTVEVTYQEYNSSSNYQGLTTATIPETVTNNGTTYSVTSIGNYAFMYCTSLTSITLPNSVTSIGSSAFKGCSSITSITLPNSVTSIGSSAFKGCTSLPVEDNLRYADTYLVEAVDKSLSTYTIKAETKWIGSEAFDGCSSLTSITLPNSVTSIGYGAFGGCTSLPIVDNLRYADTYLVEAVDKSLSTYTIKAGTKWIGSEAFDGCSSLTSITIPNSVTSIGDWAFDGCSSITSITIPNSVTSVGDFAFYACSALTSITMGNSVTSIGWGAFWECSSLTSITIPNSVTSIESETFRGCSSLTSITIPNSVTSIRDYAFMECSALTSIEVESGNTVYDSRENCNAIIETASNTLIAGCQSTTIPNSVTSIGDEAFSGCSSLASITIPNSVTSIGDWAFSDCSSLTSITIPNSVTSIGDYAFVYCSSLTSVTLGNSVTSIGEGAFQGCSSLTSITLPNSVTGIGNYAFKGCSSLTSITLPNSVTSIGWAAFDGCSSLTSITLPNSVTSIGWAAFDGCSSLTSITLPNSVTSIGDWAFSDCSSLTSITIPNSVTSIGDGAFRSCSALTSVTIGNSVTSIGDLAFYNCSALTSITIGSSVTSIGYRAFSGCSSLTSITLPNSVTSIGDWAFDGCSSLTSVTSLSCTPPSCEGNLFNGTPSEKTLVVPSISMDAYKNSSTWKEFTSFESIVYPSITLHSSDSTLGIAQIDQDVDCDSVAIISAVGNPGYAFTQWSDGNTDNPRTIKLTQDTTLTAEFAPTQYTLTTTTNYADRGTTQGDTIADYLTEIQVSATANYGYHFTQWGDGNTDNPRTILLTKDTNLVALFEKNQYTITTSCNAEQGTISGTQVAEYLDEITLNVLPNVGWHFTQWTDSNTDNPRTFTLTQDTAFAAEFALDYSGKCGDDLYWAYSNQEVRITGSGAMYNYTDSTMPWTLLRDSIKTVRVGNNATSIGAYAFANTPKLAKLHIGTNVEDIGANAFAGCRRLYDIYCYATNPPFAETNSFANYNVYVHVPCASLDAYDTDVVFGSFKYVECIGAEDTVITDKTVTVVPGDADATFTWPVTDNADTYSLVITKDGVTFCTLVFNAQGQLVSIAFKPRRQNAPAEEGTTPATYAEMTANGFRFTVTGLDEGTDYAYTLTVRKASNSVLETYTGDFTTLSNTPTGINESAGEDAHGQVEKLLRDGQVLILRNGETYDMMGQRL